MRVAISLGVLGGVAAIAAIQEQSAITELETEKRNSAKVFAASLTEAISGEVHQKFIIASGVGAAVSIAPNINQDQFSRLGEEVFRDEPALVSLSTIQNLRITHVHPLEQNSSILGADLSDMADRVNSMKNARDSGKGEIQGPIQLMLGGTGFIIREAVFEAGVPGTGDVTSPKFWGLISLVFAADGFFEEVGLPEMGRRYNIAIRNTSALGPGAVYGDQTLFQQAAISSSISLPNGAWQMAIAPVGGWGVTLPNTATTRTLFFLGAVFAVFLSQYILDLRTDRNRVAGQLRGAIEVLPDGFVIYDNRDRMVMCNDKYKEFYAKSAAAMVPGNTFEHILRYGLAHGQYKKAEGREEEWLQERLRAHTEEESFVEQHLEDGRWLRIIERATPDGGRAGVRLDITALKQHEITLAQSNAHLQAAIASRDAAEARFAELSDISTEWFWEQDEQLRFSFFSNSFQRSTGIDPNTLLGKNREDFMETEVGPNGEGGLSSIIRATKAHEPFRDFIYQAVNLRKEEIWIRTSGKPFFDDEGVFRGYRGTAADVTPLYTAMREAQMADRAKTQFLNVISHELRTPLTVLLGYNRFLTKPELLPVFRKLAQAADTGDTENLAAAIENVRADIQKYAERMDAAGAQLRMLISDMLDLARIESNTIRIEAERVEVQPKVESVIEQFAVLANQKNLTLHNEVGDHVLLCDKNRLRQIFNNLVGNAIKFTEQGTITIRSEETDDMVFFHVEDTGIGISEEMLPRIFDRFLQADTQMTRNISGVGLGLTITRELVTLHGGQITVQSTPGKGSRFTFSIPRWLSDAQAELA